MATVADLYAQVLGRPASQIDAEGLAYWTNMFGPTVDANEAATFKSVAQQTEPSKVAAISNWLTSNPNASDAEITAAAKVAGVSANEISLATGVPVSQVSARMDAAAPAAQTIVTQAQATNNPLEYVNKAISLPDTITDYRGKSYDLAQLKSLASQLATIADPAHLSGGAFGEKEGNIGFAYKDLAGALGASPTTFDQVLMDAARGLVDRGITDINQIKPPEGAGADYTGAGKGAGETYTGPGKTSYAVDFINGKPYLNVTGDSTSFFNSDLGKAALAGGAYFAAPMLSGAIGGATGLTGANLAAATGATLGAGGAALTGNDVLKGALLGGVVGYGTGMLGRGTAPSAATLDAQFISADATQLAQQGLSQAAIEQNLIAAGVDAFTAADAAQLALQGIKGTQLEGLLTQSAGGNPLFVPNVSGIPTGGTPNTTGTPTGTGTGTGLGTGTLTPTDLTNLVKAGVGLTGLLGGAKIVGNLTGGTGGLTLPTQDRSGISSGSAQYSPEYYQALQAKYNQLLPQQPRDVTTELKNWYETKYAPTATITPTIPKVA